MQVKYNTFKQVKYNTFKTSLEKIKKQTKVLFTETKVLFTGVDVTLNKGKKGKFVIPETSVLFFNGDVLILKFPIEEFEEFKNFAPFNNALFSYYIDENYVFVVLEKCIRNKSIFTGTDIIFDEKKE